MTNPAGGEPVHTRAQSVLVRLREDGLLVAHGSLLDLRTRGFLPVGGDMQGMGIIHHMELAWTVDPVRGVLERWTPAQPCPCGRGSRERRDARLESGNAPELSRDSGGR
jgi:hypothetical protein